jgi:hypothetical protein
MIISRLFAIVVLVLAANTGMAADISRFVGHYEGSAEIEAEGELVPRDMSVDIAENEAGFEVAWKSIGRRADGSVLDKEFNIAFVPTDRDGIFSSAMKVDLFGHASTMDPMQGDPFVWARITGDTLTVFSMLIDEDGGYEIQEYNRTLAEGGLQLEYLRIRNGEKLRAIEAFLQKG